MEDIQGRLKIVNFKAEENPNLEAVIEAVAAAPLESQLCYFFREDVVKDNPQYFQQREDGLYTTDGVKVVVYPIEGEKNGV